MMKRIMKPAVAAVALAASALFAAPATAEKVSVNSYGVQSIDLRGERFDASPRLIQADHRGRGRGHARRGVPLNEFGQTPREAQYLIDQALYECECQLKIDARRLGYVDAQFRRVPYVEQIGPRGFVIKARTVLFDGYSRSRQPYECVVRRGSVRRATDIYPASFGPGGFHHNRGRRGGVSISVGTRF
ncbi:MAG: hypothetical protein AAGJ29_02240 [Pseudomonadota bacterium]